MNPFPDWHSWYASSIANLRLLASAEFAIAKPDDDNCIPKSKIKIDTSIDRIFISNNPVIESILNQTQANEANPNVIQQIDNGNEILIEENDTEEEEGNFFQRLFKGKKK